MRALVLFLVSLVVSATPAWADCVDINAADAKGLEALPQIGPSKAAEIIKYRDQHGPFASADDLDAVPGIGPKTMEALRPAVCPIDAASTGSYTPPPPADDDLTEEPPPPPKSSSKSSSSKKAAPSGAININTASTSELMGLPGIGKVKAEAIVADREANGPFATCDDLGRVNGIGPATVSQVKSACTTE